VRVYRHDGGENYSLVYENGAPKTTESGALMPADRRVLPEVKELLDVAVVDRLAYVRGLGVTDEGILAKALGVTLTSDRLQSARKIVDAASKVQQRVGSAEGLRGSIAVPTDRDGLLDFSRSNRPSPQTVDAVLDSLVRGDNALRQSVTERLGNAWLAELAKAFGGEAGGRLPTMGFVRRSLNTAAKAREVSTGALRPISPQVETRVSREGSIASSNVFDGRNLTPADKLAAMGMKSGEVQFMPAHSPEGAQYTDSVLAKLRAVTREGSDGDTFNQDGTQYTGGGLVVPLVSRNFDRNAIKIDDIQAFKDANADKMSPAVKVGVYKFPNSEEMSVDLNIVVDPKNEALARRVGAELGQESLFDLGSFDNVKTGASGKNTLPLNPEQFKRLGDALSKGEYPQDVINEAYAQNPEIAKAIKAETAVKPAVLDPANPAAYMPAGKADVQFKSKAKEGSVGGVLDLVHFSSKDVMEIDPNKSFGKGAAQIEDRKGLNKAFFYTKGTSYENGIARRPNIYEAKVDGNAIYDYNADPLGVRGILNRTKREQAIVDAGFAGYYSETPGFDAVAMFETTKLKPTDAESVMNRRQLIDTGRAESTLADEKAFAKQDAQIARDEANAEKLQAKTEAAVKKSPEYKAEYKRLVASDEYIEGSFFFDQQMDSWVGEQVDKRLGGAGALMPAEKADGPLGDATVGRAMGAPEGARIISEGGDTDTLPLFQRVDAKGNPMFEPLSRTEKLNGDEAMPKVVKQDYDFLESPSLRDYSGQGPEDASVPDFNSIPYKLTKGEKEGLASAIKSGAIDDAKRRLAAKIRTSMENPEIAAGKGWYGRMRQKLLGALGEDGRELFSQLLGATSARTPVDENFMQAYDAFQGVKEGRYSDVVEKYLKLREASQVKNKAQKLKSLQAYVEKTRAESVVRGDVIELEKKITKLGGKNRLALRKKINALKEVLDLPKEERTAGQWMALDIMGSRLTPMRSNGKRFNANSLPVLKVLAGVWLADAKAPKTPNFAGNLTGRTLQATIDVWAARAVRDLLYSGSGKPWRIQPKAEGAVSNVDFAVGQEIFKRAAKELGMAPDDLQAIAWFDEKNTWQQRGWSESTAGNAKSSFDGIFDIFFPAGEKPRGFEEAVKLVMAEREARKAAGELELPPQEGDNTPLADEEIDLNPEELPLSNARTK
jgi:hypothetical protein